MFASSRKGRRCVTVNNEFAAPRSRELVVLSARNNINVFVSPLKSFNFYQKLNAKINIMRI